MPDPQTQTNQDPYAVFGGSVATAPTPPTTPPSTQTQPAPSADPYAAFGGSVAPATPTVTTPIGETLPADVAARHALTRQGKSIDYGQGPITPYNPDDQGVSGSLKRTVTGLQAMYHAFFDPATEQEKAELVAKARKLNAGSPGAKAGASLFPEQYAADPPRAMLALHRLLDAPADRLLEEGQDEEKVAQDLINNHEYWKGGNLYIDSLEKKLASGIPLVPQTGYIVSDIARRADQENDPVGALTDIATLLAAEKAPAIVKGGAKIAQSGLGLAAKAPGAAAAALGRAAEAIKPEWLTKAEEVPKPQHGPPVHVESPLDGPTVGKQLGGQDLSQEALDTLQSHVGDKIPAGSTAKNRLAAAVEPVQKTINDTASKMNQVVQSAPKFTTSVMQDNVFGTGKFTDEIDAIKKSVPPSLKSTLVPDIEDVMEDADKALNSNDPAEVLEYRRQLGKKIDWDDIQKNPGTPKEAQNLARVKVYQAIGEKIHTDIPDTVPLDKTLQPNLELRSHMKAKLGQRLLDDPLAATAEAQSEFKKGKDTVENAAHNRTVEDNWKKIGAYLRGLGYTGAAYEILKHFVQ